MIKFFRKFKKWILGFLIGGTALAAGLSGIPQDFYNNLNVKIYTACDLQEARITSIVDSFTTLKARNPDNSLREFNAQERASVKSCEMAKRGTEFAGIYDSPQYGTKIEIIGDVKAIEVNGQSGVELFARAWRGTQQLGFGADGSVEIERFRIFNPPILVDDPNGTIIRDYIDPNTKQPAQWKLREDPIEAIRQVIAHNATLVGKDNGKIVIGKVGNTTSTFYPDADPESTSVDGQASFDNSTTAWSTIQSAADSALASDTGGQANHVYVGQETSNRWWLYRSFYLFDTSALGDTDTIDSASFNLYVTSTTNFDTGTAKYISLVSSSPASDTAITTADYDQVGTTKLATDINTVDITLNEYKPWILNATGITNISKTDVSKFALRHGQDLNNEQPSVGGDNGINGARFQDYDGTTSGPKLVVEHTSPAVQGGEYLIIFEE